MNDFVKHTFIYFLSKGIPGILSFVAILYYSKALTPAEYGMYSLIISIVGIVNIVFFDWFRFGMSRYLPEYIVEQRRDEFLVFVKNKIQLVAIIFLGLTILYYFSYPFLPYFGIERTTVLFIGILVILQYLFTLLTQIFITELKPNDYMKANFIRSFFGVLISVVLVYFGYGYMGLVFGMIFSFVFSVFYSLFRIKFPKSSFSLNVDKKLLKKITLYSLPLSASAGLSFMLSYSNRFIINHYRSVEETGLFSLGFDFSQQTIGIFISIAATSAFPIAMKIYSEEGNTDKLKNHMNKSLLMIFIIALPIVVVFCSTSNDLSHLLLGKKFSKLDTLFLPIISLNAFILGIKSFYLDLYFYLKKETKYQMFILMLITTVNIILNIIFVPKFGYIAAVWCGLFSSVLAVFTTYLVVNRILHIKIEFLSIIKVIAACLFMFFSIELIGDSKNLMLLILKLLLGGLVFLILIGLLNKNKVSEIIQTIGKK